MIFQTEVLFTICFNVKLSDRFSSQSVQRNFSQSLSNRLALFQTLHATSVYVYVCVYKQTCTSLYPYMCVNVTVHLCIYVCACMSVCICKSVVCQISLACIPKSAKCKYRSNGPVLLGLGGWVEVGEGMGSDR